MSNYPEFFRASQAALAALDTPGTDLRDRYRSARALLLACAAAGYAVPERAREHLDRLQANPEDADALSDGRLRVALDDILALGKLGKVARWL